MTLVHRQLMKAFDAACDYRHRPHEVMDAFLDECLYRFGLSRFAPDDATAEVREVVAPVAEEYGRAVPQAGMFADLLGPVYMELSSRGQQKWLGQFFTPWDIALLMAAMTLGDCVAEPADGKLIRVLEPTCGAGVTVLAALHHVTQVRGIDELRRWSFTLVDLDRTCARMAAVQLLSQVAAFGVTLGELVVWRGDSLRLTHDELIVHAVAAPAGSAALAPASSPQIDLFAAGAA